MSASTQEAHFIVIFFKSGTEIAGANQIPVKHVLCSYQHLNVINSRKKTIKEITSSDLWKEINVEKNADLIFLRPPSVYCPTLSFSPSCFGWFYKQEQQTSADAYPKMEQFSFGSAPQKHVLQATPHCN